MKKTICILLAGLCCFFITSCGKTQKTKTPEIDLQYYALLGQIPESPYKLGENPEIIKEELSAKAEDTEETEEIGVFSISEGETSVRIDNGEFAFFYEIDKESSGISYIVDFTDAYHFEPGSIISDVKQKLDPYPVTEREAKEGELFALFGDTPRTVLEYNFEKRKVMFVFEDNALVATILTDTDKWSN